MKRTILFLMLAACGGSTAGKPQTAIQPVADLAGRRAQMIQWLHEYGDAGAFPTDGAGDVISVFRDTKGVRCPMAELIHRSGRDDLVDAVATTANDLRLADVHGGPLYDWMLQSGLTLKEIELVQGIAQVNYVQIDLESVPDRIAAGRAEVRGHLVTAEKALRDNTAQSLPIVLAGLARTPTAGPIVPPPDRRTRVAQPAPRAPRVVLQSQQLRFPPVRN